MEWYQESLLEQPGSCVAACQTCSEGTASFFPTGLDHNQWCSWSWGEGINENGQGRGRILWSISFVIPRSCQGRRVCAGSASESGCLLDGAMAMKQSYDMLTALFLDFMCLCHAPGPSTGFSRSCVFLGSHGSWGIDLLAAIPQVLEFQVWITVPGPVFI